MEARDGLLQVLRGARAEVLQGYVSNVAVRAERVGKTVSENHSGAGQNVLYMDGHVTWTAQCRVGVNGDNIWLAQGVYVYTGSEKPRSPADAFLLPSGLE